MKKRMLCVSAACLLALMQMPVLAAEDAPQEDYMIISPSYEFDQPVACRLEIGCSEVPENVSVQVYQHSPERESLLLYDFESSEINGAAAVRMALEPGAYTVTFTSRLLDDGNMTQILHADFQAENPDDDDALSFTYYTMHIRETHVSDETEFGSGVQPARTHSDDDGRFFAEQDVILHIYDRMRGDIDGDKKITAADAQTALIAASKSLAELDPDLTPGKLIVCDTDHNGIISPKESLEILRYFAAGISELDQVWSKSQYVL